MKFPIKIEINLSSTSLGYRAYLFNVRSSHNTSGKAKYYADKSKDLMCVLINILRKKRIAFTKIKNGNHIDMNIPKDKMEIVSLQLEHFTINSYQEWKNFIEKDFEEILESSQSDEVNMLI